MNENIYEALEVCLEAIETGVDIEAVLKRYPQMADELRPILEASFQAKSLAATSVPEDAMRRGRARVLQHAAGMREAARSPRRSIFSFPRLAVSLALAFIFILSGTGLVRASNGALPGDNLYPIKRTWEDMRLFLVFSPAEREELEDEFEQERLHEVDELLGEGRHQMIAFTGVVTEKNGDQWVVSGISVQIMPDSQLPAEPVTLGATIMVEGYTNAQGFVEADRVEILEPDVFLPPSGPDEIDDLDDNQQIEDSVFDDNDNGDQDEMEEEISPDDDSNDDEGDDVENGNDTSKDEDDGDDSSSNSSPGGGDNDNSDDHDDNSGSGSGDDDSDNGDDDD